MKALEAMNGQAYFDTEDQQNKVFQLDRANPDPDQPDQTVRQVAQQCLRIDAWELNLEQEDKRQLQEVREEMGAAAAENMAAIRLWTCSHAQVYTSQQTPHTSQSYKPQSIPEPKP